MLNIYIPEGDDDSTYDNARENSLKVSCSVAQNNEDEVLLIAQTMDPSKYTNTLRSEVCKMRDFRLKHPRIPAINQRIIGLMKKWIPW
jgi:hypothetical protein